MSNERTLIMASADSRGTQWYFNTLTEQPEQGKLSAATHRMGPYKSREDALRAWQIVKERNQKWEDDDKKWRGEEAAD